jgi:hypothetical protein
MRQKDDMQFAELLNRLRENSLTDDDLVLLHTRTVTTDDSSNFTHTILGDLVLLSNILISHEEPFVKPPATSMFAVRSYFMPTASSTCIARFAVFD